MAAFPPPPTDTIDWANVGFQVREVNGHIESTYSKSTGQWTPLKFVASPFMRIHGMAPALNYGQQAYEGLKAFRGPGDDTIALFRPDRNALRLQHSADVASMPRVPEQTFLDACRAAVALNAAFVPPHATGAAMYVRPQIYGSSAQLGLSPPDEYTFAVFVIPTGVYHGVHPVKALILDEFDRAAPHGTGHAKVGGNYAPETVTFIPDAQADAGPVCLQLLGALKGIQSGKAEDAFGWRFAVTEADGAKVVVEANGA
ncbi:Drug resistance protein [Verticillium dahliae VDG2]|nr:Drug resistance protein [Verticillium dahliae VDG2]